MTSGRRSKQRRQQARLVGHPAHMRLSDGVRKFDGERIGPDADCGVTIGWCATEADLTEARRQTHDSLIKMMGALRTGPVGWQWHTGAEANTVMAEMLSSPEARDETFGNYYRQIRGKLREFGGFVVLAYAPGDKP